MPCVDVPERHLAILKKAAQKIINLDERVTDVFLFGSAARNLLGIERGKCFSSTSDYDIGITAVEDSLKLLSKIRFAKPPIKIGTHTVSYRLAANKGGPPEDEIIILEEVEQSNKGVAFCLGTPPELCVIAKK
ncbi:hypothetical protein LCGC14_1720400 [marine sediment metagenome]|uniref:Uncharacterized protein n=1 Tax=marine sediment metagenome TaxID=412755 RepID=A0A0F9JT27_9ZZZZ